MKPGHSGQWDFGLFLGSNPFQIRVNRAAPYVRPCVLEIIVPSNYFHTRERLGALGGIVQHHTALYRSVAVYEPAVLIVRRGSKKLRWARRELRVRRLRWQADRRLTLLIFPIQTASIRRNGLLLNRKP
ncbi:hypothetical protein AN159_04980 [Neisseria meningitidis]|nr:hypothetical protein AN159_04980 [Neisseria meningitidis]